MDGLGLRRILSAENRTNATLISKVVFADDSTNSTIDSAGDIQVRLVEGTVQNVCGKVCPPFGSKALPQGLNSLFRFSPT